MVSSGAQVQVQVTSVSSRDDSATNTLARARSDDLVIGLVGHIGAGLDTVRAQLHEEFRQASYEPAVVNR